MSKRNAHAMAARARKAGAHSGSRRPEVQEDMTADLCPVCETTPLTGCGVWNVILGEVCTLDCLEEYWKR